VFDRGVSFAAVLLRKKLGQAYRLICAMSFEQVGHWLCLKLAPKVFKKGAYVE